ncbi:MAG: hemolysin III family protein [Clostridia bacterium]|nr:hemolysin III family protein [Clostridia bacterium]
MGHHYYQSTRDNTAAFSCFQVKDPWSALTHFIGFLFAVFFSSPLLIHATQMGASFKALTSLSIFMISMALLYGASTAYHTFLVDEKKSLILKKLDHTMIFVLIAGTYTPLCTCVLPEKSGTVLLIVVWAIALLGIGFKLFFVNCPKWVSSVLYIGMGWSCLAVFPQLFRLMNRPSFCYLLIGGIIYTVGGLLYALKLKKLNELSPSFGSHEIFHVCVMLGSFFHYLTMYNCIK